MLFRFSINTVHHCCCCFMYVFAIFQIKMYQALSFIILFSWNFFFFLLFFWCLKLYTFSTFPLMDTQSTSLFYKFSPLYKKVEFSFVLLGAVYQNRNIFYYFFLHCRKVPGATNPNSAGSTALFGINYTTAECLLNQVWLSCLRLTAHFQELREKEKRMRGILSFELRKSRANHFHIHCIWTTRTQVFRIMNNFFTWNVCNASASCIFVQQCSLFLLKFFCEFLG